MSSPHSCRSRFFPGVNGHVFRVPWTAALWYRQACRRFRAAALLLILFLSAGLLTGCNPLPSLEGRSVSTVVTDTNDTPLGVAISPLTAAHPGKAGIYPLVDAHNAFGARVLLAQAAVRTLDIQYYIWRGDMTGTLLFDALRKAADRGVRVRLMLDDLGSLGLDATLAALDAHPNIEVRLFNPFANRRFPWGGFLTDFSRLNRRMHHKSFTADSQATIIGGRNVGDEYFAATDDFLFADLDVIAVGPVVKDVSHEFDRYWASESAYPIDRLLGPAGETPLQDVGAAASFVEKNPAATEYLDAIKESAFMLALLRGTLPLEWAKTQMVSDDPLKGLGKAPPEAMLPVKLRRIIGDPEKEVDLVSPYFVPTAVGVDAFAAMSRRGVTVRILTNALEATDVAVVHSGYARRRKPLLQEGVILYEFKRIADMPVHPKGPRLISSASGSSLHAKTFSVDRSRVFVGSLNFDPRSANLNTEMGFVIESPILAARIDDAFKMLVPLNAYEVRLDDNGSLYWLERVDGKEVRHDTEPGTTFWKRTAVWLLSLLPIEWML
ncbi:phospholipase D family protein [Noviherbaspirillum cavernae]|uniref:Phospholipase D family protein n=1 Tax=Noviherbaspirillum cavernae TaxID=2320862 RepID=A0A418WVV7_9BURK|nr:phospholipase D family protein [Noviherbaspirillum cavernae]